MTYLPPFQQVKELFNISTVKGEVFVTTSYDNFVKAIQLLLAGVAVDEAWYLRRYPDVAEAINGGLDVSAQRHFIENGYFEGRFPAEPSIDEQWYLRQYPDVSESVSRGDFQSALRHFMQEGYREGRLPFAA